MHHEILNTYRTMHAIRCETSTREQWLLDKVQLLEYETAMMRHVDAMINTALTGRITPLVLSSQHLRKLIEVHATLKQSLTAQQPALAYEFGRAIPVRLDLTSLRFAFILVLPTPRSHDVVTTFRVHNVGFYQKPESTGEIHCTLSGFHRIVTSRARLALSIGAVPDCTRSSILPTGGTYSLICIGGMPPLLLEPNLSKTPGHLRQ
jgi:hypothetical protein